MEEKWEDVVGYEGIYEVSDHGRVRTKEGKQTHSVRHGIRTWKQRILKEKNTKGRDVRVGLWKDGKPKSFLVHQLVGKAFLPLVDGKIYINHIDGNPRNNHVSNLEWCNHKENNNHAFDTGLMTCANRTVLEDVETGDKHQFRSHAKACEFLQRGHSYIFSRLKNNHEYMYDINNKKYRIFSLD